MSMNFQAPNELKEMKIRADGKGLCPLCGMLKYGIRGRDGTHYSFEEYAKAFPKIEGVGVVCDGCGKPYRVPVSKFR